VAIAYSCVDVPAGEHIIGRLDRSRSVRSAAEPFETTCLRSIHWSAELLPCSIYEDFVRLRVVTLTGPGESETRLALEVRAACSRASG